MNNKHIAALNTQLKPKAKVVNSVYFYFKPLPFGLYPHP